MRETKLILLLRTFENSELKALDKFIQSPYFNSSEVIIKLWKHLKKYAPKFDAPQLDKEKTFKKIYSKEAYNDKKLRQLRSRLFKLIEEFLATQQFKKDDLFKRQKLATAYYEKDFYSSFEEATRDMIAEISTKDILHDGDYLDLIQLHHQLFFNQRSTKHLPSPPDLWQCSEKLAAFYWLRQLKYACEWSCRRFLSIEKRPKNIDISPIPSKFLSPQFPLFNFYFNIYTLFNQSIEKGETLFFETANVFLSTTDTIPLKEKTPLLLYLLNYCIVCHRKQEQKYLPIFFSLNKVGLETGAFLWKNQLQNAQFLNSVFIGCKLKEFEWVEQFILAYQSKLNPTTKTAIATNAMAIRSFYQQKYKDAFYQLEQIKFKKASSEIGRKSFQVRCGFECFLQKRDFYEVLQYKSESLKKFISRKGIINEQKRIAFSNLNNAVRQTATLVYQNADKKAFDKVIKKVEKQTPFSEKSWLLHHLDTFGSK